MKFRALSTIAVICFSFCGAAAVYANEVLLTANQPTKITFRVAHKNQDGQPVFGALQSAEINKNVTVPVDLGGYALAGVVIVSANGHELPPSDNQFDQPKQCSMTTDKTKATGALEFTLSEHSISCRTYGGIFG